MLVGPWRHHTQVSVQSSLLKLCVRVCVCVRARARVRVPVCSNPNTLSLTPLLEMFLYYVFVYLGL